MNFKINELQSGHFNDRPARIDPDTIVLHSMYNPEAENPFSVLACKELLDRYGVSAHYLVDREGERWRLVDEKSRAWHAGVSRMPTDDRENVNDFSVGVELIGSENSGFTASQYESAISLTLEIAERLPVRYILGHAGIAPDRKTDPWRFDWDRFRQGFLSDNADARQIVIFGEN